VAQEPLIAVVDDDETLRESLVDVLHSYGYDAIGFGSAEEFIASDFDSFNCIVSDIHMAGMSGIDLMHLLNGRGFRVPMILITARTEVGLEERVSSAGAASLLIKPIEADVLINSIEKYLKM
jgi:FixJ family two-component response regulator